MSVLWQMALLRCYVMCSLKEKYTIGKVIWGACFTGHSLIRLLAIVGDIYTPVHSDLLLKEFECHQSAWRRMHHLCL